jgi:hypothetical protein
VLRDGPLVVLLGEHATDEANDCGAVGKDADLCRSKITSNR